MIRYLIKSFNIYLPGYPRVLVYMLQGSEYRVGPYMEWLRRTKDFSRVMQRRTLEPTKAARMLLLALRLGMAGQVAAGLVLIGLGLWRDVPELCRYRSHAGFLQNIKKGGSREGTAKVRVGRLPGYCWGVKSKPARLSVISITRDS